MFRVAVYLYGLAAIATGLTDIAWREFDPAEEPITAFGNNVPGREIWALIVAVALVVGGAALFRRGTARLGATILAVVYSLFAFFGVPRFLTAPHYLGYHVGVFVGVLDGIFQQLILVAAAIVVIVWASADNGLPAPQRATNVARWILRLRRDRLRPRTPLWPRVQRAHGAGVHAVRARNSGLDSRGSPSRFPELRYSPGFSTFSRRGYSR